MRSAAAEGASQLDPREMKKGPAGLFVFTRRDDDYGRDSPMNP
jgi:hypothetical protein